MIRVLIADDSETCRDRMRAVLEAEGGFEVVGLAKNGREAVELACLLHPEIVTMDVDMPEMDGFAATREIMIRIAIPVVMMTDTTEIAEVENAMRATQLGALAALAKPVASLHRDFARSSQDVIDTVRAMACVQVVRHHRPRRPAARNAGLVDDRSAPEIVAIVASTGGPAALQKICAALPPTFEAPLLMVQHMSHGFVEGFVQWLGTTATRPVHVVADGQRIEPKTIYVAPDDRHFGITRSMRARLDSGAAVNGFRPSGSFLFESVSVAQGSAVLAIVLTGMGEDGASALPALRERGGRVWVQDPKTAVVSGMPDAAIATGTAERVLAVERIAPALAGLARKPKTR